MQFACFAGHVIEILRVSDGSRDHGYAMEFSGTMYRHCSAFTVSIGFLSLLFFSWVLNGVRLHKERVHVSLFIYFAFTLSIFTFLFMFLSFTLRVFWEFFFLM